MNKINPIFSVLAVIILIVILFFVMWYFSRTPSPYGNLDAFAECLAEKEVTMYGAYWCEYCKKERAGFGSSFEYIPYVECTEEVETCVAKGIEGYPTWIFPDGRKLTGLQGVEKLSEVSGCELPPLQN